MLTLAYNLLRAVQYLQSANILHRDLKPENILVTEFFEVKICDFGLARAIRHDNTKNGMQRSFSSCCFTRYYRPPEVIIG